ncbi:Atxe2 family lasso peptide isopeptidase [Sphingomonas sp. UYEF23]|uniref:Atxe2 family lasso peptide isopeptidase n=1 Tax=Sphingomonas sp. UYEF23 TaxID=1756408 RepID=UPI00339AF8B9
MLFLIPGQALAACDDLLAPAVPVIAKRAITADDLLRLRDIGQPDPSLFGMPSPLGVAPDGKRVAFVLTRADPSSNSYCRALLVIGLEAGAVPRIVDRGGGLATVRLAVRGLFAQGGLPDVATPVWSADGRWIAYLKRVGAVTQAWRVRDDGSAAEAVTHASTDVEAVACDGDGRHLVYATRPGMQAAAEAIDREGQGGYLYDDRITPNAGARPQLRSTLPLVVSVIDPETGAVTPATTLERDRLPPIWGAAVPSAASAVSGTGRRAQVTRLEHKASRLETTDERGQPLACTAEACGSGITGLWWNPSGTALWVLRREGWARGRMALYQWSPASGIVRRMFDTDDVLHGCVTARDDLVCTRENATTPRRVVRIDPTTGRSQLVFDPNPDFAGIRLGTVQRLTWRNELGLQAWGDLVLPADRHPGETLPMVVVQYHSDGFLRGGTGDEYPIQLFAAHGFAVLSVERPDFVEAAADAARSRYGADALDTRRWAERRSLLSSLVTGVQLALKRAPIDPARVGITGLSDGASTARFALLNTRLFAAAAISTCCTDPKTVMTYGGIAWADAQRKGGYPPATRDDPAFWRPYSLAVNAATMRTPLLMQLADDEYLLGLESFTALREQRQPVELYVFPDEHHIKVQPIHRRAVYERSLDWFDFWLNGHEDPDPGKHDQYARWEILRRGLVAQAGDSAGPSRAGSAR